MTLTCEMVREQIAEGREGSGAVEAHLTGCAACRAVAAALREVDGELGALALIEPPASLVERTLARVEAAEAEARVVREDLARAELAARGDAAPLSTEASAAREDRGVEGPLEVGTGSLLAAALAATLASLTAIVMAPYVAVRAVRAWLGRLAEARQARAHEERRAGANRRGPWLEVAIVAGIAGVVGTATWQRFGNMVKGKIDGSTSTLDAMPTEESEGGSGTRGWFDGPASRPSPAAFEPSPEVTRAAGGQGPATRHAGFDDDGRDLQQGVLGPANGVDLTIDGARDTASTDAPAAPFRLTLARVPSMVVTNEPVDESTVDGEPADATRGEDDHNLDRGLELDDRLHTELRAHGQGGEGERLVGGRLERSGEVEEENRRDARSSPWIARQRTEGLTLRARDGWWQSTYVPGDPAIRLVHARLSASPILLPTVARTGLAIAEDVSPIAPPLEAPRDRALAVGAFADTAAIDGPTRVRVEVALRSVAQAAGRRGPLRVAVVLDADALDADAQARVRALVTSLSRATTSRDRVALFASGRAAEPGHGGELTPLGPVRAGRLEVALRQVFGAGGGGSDAAPTSMTDAVTHALEAVSGEDGVGLVLIVTPDDVHDASLERAIHLGTVAGITTSAIGLGPRASLASLDEIALAGQGRRRIVLSDDDALAAVRAELGAAAELVARAVRVRVRLAEGVELVDVLGSRPLDAEESARTREVEQAIDEELARRLGILADRDEDESGVRMLIPAFYANDAHSIVLDLLVTRPGPVLDVDVALKDLVRLDNARASASLTLPHGARDTRGPRELRVLADVLAHDTALALTRASVALDRGDVAGAVRRVAEAEALAGALASEEPRLTALPAFEADRALLASFASALRAHDPLAHASLRDALSLAASRRLLRPRLASSE